MRANAAPVNKVAGGYYDKVKGAITTKINDLADAMSTGPSGAGAERWRPLAMAAMKRVGFNADDPAQVNAMLSQIMSESGGDPNIAQQITDVNGTGEGAGVGLLQIIPGTWAANRDPELPDNRRDPFANMVGALRYYKGRYGMDLTDVWGQGHGYDRGGYLLDGMFGLNMSGSPERVLDPHQTETYDSMLPLLEQVNSVARQTRSADMSSDLEYAGRLDGATITGQRVEKQYLFDPDAAERTTRRATKRALATTRV
jgi:hypothetical protein